MRINKRCTQNNISISCDGAAIKNKVLASCSFSEVLEQADVEYTVSTTITYYGGERFLWVKSRVWEDVGFLLEAFSLQILS